MYEFEFAESAFTTFAMLRQAWTAVNKASEGKVAKLGLTPEKLAVLWACRDFPGTVTPAEIARLLFRENQSIAGLLNRMEKEGLVKRIPKRKGKPYTEIKMTPKAQQLVGPGVEMMKELIRDFASGLTAEQQEQLRKLVRVMRDKGLEYLYIEPSQSTCAPPGQPITL
jgi:DNA-binding MarR family transcriptional regulator